MKKRFSMLTAIYGLLVSILSLNQCLVNCTGDNNYSKTEFRLKKISILPIGILSEDDNYSLIEADFPKKIKEFISIKLPNLGGKYLDNAVDQAIDVLFAAILRDSIYLEIFSLEACRYVSSSKVDEWLSILNNVNSKEFAERISKVNMPWSSLPDLLGKTERLLEAIGISTSFFDEKTSNDPLYDFYYGSKNPTVLNALNNAANLRKFPLLSNQSPETICIYALGIKRVEFKPHHEKSLMNLTSLYLHGNIMSIFPFNVSYLPNLGNIYLNDNEITSIQLRNENFKDSKVCYIDLGSNHLTSFPYELNCFPLLQSLKLYGNSISEGDIPNVKEELGKFKNLLKLDIQGTKFKKFPEMLAFIPNLAHIQFGSSEIKKFSMSKDTAKNFKNLKILGIKYCVNLRTISLSYLKSLEELTITNSPKLEKLTLSAVDAKKMLKLHTFCIYGSSKLKEFPKFVFEFKNLKRLELVFDNKEIVESLMNMSDDSIQKNENLNCVHIVLRFLSDQSSILKKFKDIFPKANVELFVRLNDSVNPEHYIEGLKPIEKVNSDEKLLSITDSKEEKQ